MSLAKAYQVPDWFDAEKVTEAKAQFPDLMLTTIHAVAGAVGVAERRGDLPDHLSSIFEFGSYNGEGLAALDMFAVAHGATVTGSERSRYARQAAQRMAELLLRTVDSVEADGITVLRDHPESYDVVLANMFGPSYTDQEFPGRFVPAALGALRSGGVLIINSDPRTMEQVDLWTADNLEQDNLAYLGDRELPVGFGQDQPHMIITK